MFNELWSFCSYFCISFQKNELRNSKSRPIQGKEAVPVLGTPEKDRHMERFEEMMGEIFAGKSGSNSRG